MHDIRKSINSDGNGVITVILRDVAMVTSEEPSHLNSFEINILNKEESSIKKKLKQQ